MKPIQIPRSTFNNIIPTYQRCRTGGLMVLSWISKIVSLETKTLDVQKMLRFKKYSNYGLKESQSPII